MLFCFFVSPKGDRFEALAKRWEKRLERMRSTAAPWTECFRWSFFVPKTHLEPLKNHGWKRSLLTGWWFQILFIFTPTCGRFPIWLIFFKWVETTNQFWNDAFFLGDMLILGGSKQKIPSCNLHIPSHGSVSVDYFHFPKRCGLVVWMVCVNKVFHLLFTNQSRVFGKCIYPNGWCAMLGKSCAILWTEGNYPKVENWMFDWACEWYRSCYFC